MKESDILNLVNETGVVYRSASASSEMRLVKKAREGVSKKSLLSIAEFCGLSLKEIAELLPVSLRTLQRYSDSDLLDSAVSEHVLQMAEVISKGNQVFNSMQEFQNWLHSPNMALGGEKPVSLLDTGFGARLIIGELGRLEQGVYS